MPTRLSLLDALDALTNPTYDDTLDYDAQFIAHIPRPQYDTHLERFVTGDRARLMVERTEIGEIWTELQITHRNFDVAIVPYGDVVTDARLTALMCSLRAAARSAGYVVLVIEERFGPRDS